MRLIVVLTWLVVAALVLSATPVLAASGTRAGNAAAAAALAKTSCTPGYSPCIPNKSSDVDCWGGSGNGPRYTKPGVVYHVTGWDRYGLDANHNHWGCE